MSSLPEPTGERRAVLPSARRDGNVPPPQQTSQRVSVDEMLTQLRNPEGGRRRRRTEQPVYKQRRKRRLWIFIVMGVILLAAAGLWGFRIFQRYRLEGETFRQGVNRRISAALGSDVEFTRIHDGGAGALAAKEAEIITRGNDLLESARLADVSASLTSRSWMSNEWGITQLSIGSGTIKLNPNRPPSSAGPAEPVAAVQGGDESRMTISAEPRLITLDAIRTSGLNIEWPDAADAKKTESIRKLQGGPKVRGGALEGSFINGVMSLRGLPELTLNSITWKLTGRHLDITGGRITAGAGVQFEFSGKADLVPDGGVTLSVDVVETQLASLFPGWKDRISGSLEAKNCAFQATFGKGPERSLSGDFTVKGALLTNLGFLGKLKHFLQRHDMNALEFPVLKGHFAWSPSRGLVLTRLVAEKEAFLRLAGDVSVNGAGEVRGGFKVSAADPKLNEAVENLKAAGESSWHPFRPEGDGWSSFEFRVSGSAAAMDDDIPLARAGAGPNAAPPPPNGPAGTQRQQPPPPPSAKDDPAAAERAFKDLLQQPK